MNQEKNRFWVTCPFCKKKFGVNSEKVLKHVDRLVNEGARKFANAVQKWQVKKHGESQ